MEINCPLLPLMYEAKAVAKLMRAPRAIFSPRAVFLARPRRVPRAAPEHGRFPMEAAARIASINFAIAFTLINYPIKVMAENWSQISSRALVSRAESHRPS